MIRRLLLTETDCTNPFRNLAAEALLLRRAEAGTCVLYLWQNERTVVIGRNQDARSECRCDLLEADGGFLARRRTGGGAVYHDLGNLNFSFVTREADYDLPRQNAVLTEAVRALGLTPEVSGRNDLLACGRKFSGHAYRRSGGAALHHGTLMIDVDGERLARYLNVPAEKLRRKGVASVRSRVVNLAALCPGLTAEAMKAHLRAAFGAVFGLPAEEAALTDLVDPAELAAETARFADPAWRFGREAAGAQCLQGSFPWGAVTLCFTLKEGRFTDVTLYSDGLEAEALAALPAHLEGIPCEADALQTALTGTLPPQMAADLLGRFIEFRRKNA